MKHNSHDYSNGLALHPGLIRCTFRVSLCVLVVSDNMSSLRRGLAGVCSMPESFDEAGSMMLAEFSELRYLLLQGCGADVYRMD